jgi:hypothetical protein
MDIRMVDGNVVDTTGNFNPKVVDSIPSYYDGTYGDCMDMRNGCIDLNDFKPWFKDHWDNRKPFTVELFFNTITGSSNSVLFGCVGWGGSDTPGDNCPGNIMWTSTDLKTRTVYGTRWLNQTTQIYGHAAGKWEYVIYCVEGEYAVTMRGSYVNTNYIFDGRNNFTKIEGQIVNSSPLRVGGRTYEFNSATRPAGVRWPAYLHHVRVYDYAITKTRNNT